MVRAPGHDVACAVRTSVRDAGVAAGDIRLPAIQAVAPGQQVDLRTDRVIIVDGHVERHAQAVDQRADIHIHPEQVVDMHPRHVHRSQHQRPGRPTVAVGKASAGWLGRDGTDSAAPRSVACQQQEARLIAEARHQAVDMPADTAAEFMRHHQDHRQLRLAEQRRGDGEAERNDRTQGDMTGDVVLVGGISFQYQFHRPLDQLARPVAETD